jgi:hypothetical protein
MARLRLFLVTLMLLLIPAFSLQAQDVPPQLALALNQLSQRIGRPLSLTDLDSWSFTQDLYTDTALGCSFAVGEARPEGFPGMTFLLVYQGISYDYRVAVDGSLTFPCDQTLLQQQNATPQPGNCPADFAGYLPPRLNPGGQARIGLGGISNRMRVAPNSSAEQIGVILPGSTVSILDGPSCEEASHIIWWRVDDNGTVGWTAEGVLPEDYFLDPVGESLPAERSLITPGNVDALTLLVTVSQSGVNSIGFSSDGRLMAVGGRSGLAVYDMTTLSLRTPLGDVSIPVLDVDFSPDGRYLAYTAMDGRLFVRDLNNTVAAPTLLVNPANDRHASIDFNPAARTLLASGGGPPLSALLLPPMWRFYELPSQQEVLVQETDDWVRAVAFSPDGTLFAWMDSSVHVVEIGNGTVTPVVTLALEEAPLGGLAWQPNAPGEEPLHALAFADGAAVRLVDLDLDTEQTYLGDDGFLPQALSFNQDGTLLAAMDVPTTDTTGSTVNIFSVDTGDVTVSTVLDASRALRFSPDGTLLVIASSQEVILMGISGEDIEAVG